MGSIVLCRSVMTVAVYCEYLGLTLFIFLSSVHAMSLCDDCCCVLWTLVVLSFSHFILLMLRLFFWLLCIGVGDVK